MRMVSDFFPRIYAQVVLHHPIATTSHFQFYCVCLLLNFWSWFSLLCADGEPCKVIKLHPFSKQDALAADVARDHLYVHMRYGAHGSLIQIYSPPSLQQRDVFVQRFDRPKYCFLAYIFWKWLDPTFVGWKALLGLQFIKRLAKLRHILYQYTPILSMN